MLPLPLAEAIGAGARAGPVAVWAECRGGAQECAQMDDTGADARAHARPKHSTVGGTESDAHADADVGADGGANSDADESHSA